ncbi:hypothetical protein PV04_07064 [Phialophora macrospora]|uniref:Apple domain-containing protein n=1 Tax=Phialophora macrospora TaxID=1851006 RepID=A0A0D2FMD0_9EURO|nr:hypothetical protein PV04_07064 [Phialophora macrospora]
MHSHSFGNCFSLLLALITAVTAAPGGPPGFPGGPGGGGHPPYPTTCYTSIVSRRPGRPTTGWSTVTTSCTSTSTVTSTVTPIETSTVTSSVTVTSTADTVTSTAITTSTTTTVETSTTTATTTETSTVSAVSTSVVPASAGFLPIETTLPGASYDQDIDVSVVVKRRPVNVGVSASANVAVPKQNWSPSYIKPGAPGNVGCYEYHSQCTTTTTTLTVTGSTSTVITTSTSTSTVTTTPGATITSTVTATETSTAVTTATSTTTTQSTSFTATTTTYAACATNNLANYVNTLPIIGFSGNGSPLSTDATSEYECCVSAILNPLGALWAWTFDSSTCLIALAADGVCAAGQLSNGVGNTVEVSSVSTSSVEYGVGNAYCGLWDTFVVT